MWFFIRDWIIGCRLVNRMSEVDTNADRDTMWNRLTVAALGLTAVVVVCCLLVFIAPSLTPFAPRSDTTPTRVTLLVLPTATATFAPTWTPVVTWTPEPTDPPTPTATPRFTPVDTHTPGPSPTFPPTWTPQATPGSPPPTRSNYPFALQNNELIYTQYFFNSDCNWLGIAGLVLDTEGEPIVGLPVVLNGGGFENHVTYSGNAPAYGVSGWEHFLDNKVKEGDFRIQLYSNQGEPISDQINVRTRADCRANLIMIMFEQNWGEYVP
jgi:hypothetical protein